MVVKKMVAAPLALLFRSLFKSGFRKSFERLVDLPADLLKKAFICSRFLSRDSRIGLCPRPLSHAIEVSG